MQPHQQRVVDEKRDLDENLGKLHAFFCTHQFAGLRLIEQDLLCQQSEAMEKYSAVLRLRIEDFNASW